MEKSPFFDDEHHDDLAALFADDSPDTPQADAPPPAQAEPTSAPTDSLADLFADDPLPVEEVLRPALEDTPPVGDSSRSNEAAPNAIVEVATPAATDAVATDQQEPVANSAAEKDQHAAPRPRAESPTVGVNTTPRPPRGTRRRKPKSKEKRQHESLGTKPTSENPQEVLSALGVWGTPTPKESGDNLGTDSVPVDDKEHTLNEEEVSTESSVPTLTPDDKQQLEPSASGDSYDAPPAPLDEIIAQEPHFTNRQDEEDESASNGTVEQGDNEASSSSPPQTDPAPDSVVDNTAEHGGEHSTSNSHDQEPPVEKTVSNSAYDVHVIGTPTQGTSAVTAEMSLEEKTAQRVAARREKSIPPPRPVTPAAYSKEDRVRAELRESARQLQLREQFTPLVHQIITKASNSPDAAPLLRKLKLTRDQEDDRRQRREFEQIVRPVLAEGATAFTANPEDVSIILDMAYDTVIGLGPLGALWRDSRVTEIMINDWDKIFVEVDGRILDTPLKFASPEEARRTARDMAQRISGRAVSNELNLVTARLPGARVNFVYGTIAKSGVVITIRKHSDLLDVGKLLERQSLTEEMLKFLRDAVLARANIIVSGGTGAGKTTIINALSSFIPDNERVVTIEDSFELALTNHHVVALQTKEKASADDQIEVTQSELMINALRMRPDRIIVGEVREPDAALVLMDAANTGHDGTMTTIHGNSASLTLNDRLVVMLRTVRDVPDEVARRSVASAINLIVQVTRLEGHRFISEIAVVDQLYAQGSHITPRPIFVGELDENGTPTFSRVGGIEANTDIARRFRAQGVNVNQWLSAS